MGNLRSVYIHWWRHRRAYWGIGARIAALNAALGVCLFLLGKGYMDDVVMEPVALAALAGGLLCLLGLRAAVKIRLIYAVRKGIDTLPEGCAGFWKVWSRYLYGYLLVTLPGLIVPMVIWFEASLCILLLRWRMHFLPYTGVLEPERDIGRNGIRWGQGMVWQICIMGILTKWAAGLVCGIIILSLWLSGADIWMMAAIAGWALASMAAEPLYQTGNLLLYQKQYLAQVNPETFWMDMEQEGEIQEGQT